MRRKGMANIVVLALAATAFTAPAMAGDQTGKVIVVAGDVGNPFVFSISGTRTAQPACAADSFWAIPNPTSDNAKGLLSLVMTAFASNKTIIVHGNGGCNATFTYREEVAYLMIQ